MKKYIKINIVDRYALSDIEFFTNPKIQKEIVNSNREIEIIAKVKNNDMISTKKISKAVTDLIIHISKNKILKKYITKVYETEYRSEIECLYKKACNIFDVEKEHIKSEIFTRVDEYIRTNDSIDIEGFIKFRMKEIDMFMPKMLELAIEEYIKDKEQEEITSILRYYIKLQEDKLEVIKIKINKDETFELYDKEDHQLKLINKEEIEEFIQDNDMDYEDIYINNLLSYCPEKIEVKDNLNNKKSMTVIETIKSVFGENVYIYL